MIHFCEHIMHLSVLWHGVDQSTYVSIVYLIWSLKPASLQHQKCRGLIEIKNMIEISAKYSVVNGNKIDGYYSSLRVRKNVCYIDKAT